MPTVAELVVDVEADDKATSVLEKINALIDKYAGTDAEATLDADGDQARTEVAEIAKVVNELDSKTAEVNIESNSADVKVDVVKIQELLKSLEDQVSIAIDLDKADVTAQIDQIKAQLASIKDAEVDLDIDGALSRIVILEAALRAIPDETVTIEVDSDQGIDRLKNITAAASRASTQVSALAMAILVLGPALVPIGGVALAAIGALGAGLGAAAAGAALFGAVAMTNFADVADALTKLDTLQQAYNTAVTDQQRDAALEKTKALMASLDPGQRAMVLGIQEFTDAWGEFAARFQPEIFQLAGDGLRYLAAGFPLAVPLMDSMIASAKELQTSLENSLAGPFWTQFGATISNLAGPLFTSFVKGMGNIVTGLAGMLNAFFPFSEGFATGFEEMTAKFAEWGTSLGENEGFKSFIEYAKSNGPLVIAAIVAISNAIVALIAALAPLGTGVLAGVTALANAITLISNAAPEVVAFTFALAGLVAIFLNLTGPILAFYSVFTRLGFLFGVSGGWIAVIVVGLAALVAAVIYAYGHFEGFRNAVQAVGAAIQGFVSAAIPVITSAFQTLLQWGQQAWQWLVSNFGPAISTVVQFIIAEFQKFADWFNQNSATFAEFWQGLVSGAQAAWTLIYTIIVMFAQLIIGFVTGMFSGLATIVGGVWTAISGVISGALEIIRGIISIFVGLVTGDWTMAWNGLVAVLHGAWTAIASVVSGAIQIVLGIIQTFAGALAGFWSAAWGMLYDLLKPVLDAVVAAWEWVYNILIGNSIIPDLVNGIIEWFNKAVDFLTSFMEPIVTAISNAWTKIKDFVKNAIDAIVNTISSFISTVTSAWDSFWTSVINFVLNAWNSIKSHVTTGVSNIISAITSFISTALSAWDKFWTDLINAVIKGVQQVVQKFSDLGTKILAAITSIAGRLRDAGASLMRNLADGVASGAKWVTDSVSKVVDAATALLPGSPAEVGPLSGRGYSMLRGQRMIDDFATGIEDQSGAVAAAMAGVSGLAADGLSSVQGAPRGFTGGSVMITVSEGAVQVQVGSGADAETARAALAGAGDSLAAQISSAIRRR